MFVFFTCLLFFVCVTDDVNGSELEEYSHYELPCLTFGGICMATEECPQGRLSQIKGLCPVQQKRGVECCHGLPKSETRCRQRGGECIPISDRCPEQLTYSKATDCPEDEKCCILVN